MKKLLGVLAAALVLVLAVLLPQTANADELYPAEGRGTVPVEFKVPKGTNGYTILRDSGPGTLKPGTNPAGMEIGDTDPAGTEIHVKGVAELPEDATASVLVRHASSRDRTWVRVVLDHEETAQGVEGSWVAAGILWTQSVVNTGKGHSALVLPLRFEKSIAPGMAFAGEVEYAGERLYNEQPQWARTGSGGDDAIRIWTGLAARPRYGVRWGADAGFGLAVNGRAAQKPLGLRANILQPIELGNWLEWGGRGMVLAGPGGGALGMEAGLDAAWWRLGYTWGRLAFTGGTGAELRLGDGDTAFTLVPRIGLNASIPRMATIRLRVGFTASKQPGIRTELSVAPF